MGMILLATSCMVLHMMIIDVQNVRNLIEWL